MKMPVFKGAWAAFWLWHGTNVNEIDIAEAWGGSNPSIPWLGSDRRRNTYSTHAWGPREGESNPYNLEWGSDAASTEVRFPRQDWWNFILGTHHAQQEYHVYACEWDPIRIKTFLDDELVGTLWKYYQVRTIGYIDHGFIYNYYYKVGSDCTPDAGDWDVEYGFPYSDSSQSQVRISTAASGYITGDPNAGTFSLGEAEVDYVKIWQRHPEQDGHTDLCSHPAMSIIGPDNLCEMGQGYSLSSSAPGGTWSLSNDAVTILGGPRGGSSVVLSPNNNSSNNIVTLSYTFRPVGANDFCPPVTISKQIITGTIPTTVICSSLPGSYSSYWHTISFSAIPSGLNEYPAGTIFEWDIDAGFNSSNTSHYHLGGRFVDVDFRKDGSNQFNYYARWTLKITTPCGTYTYKGEIDNGILYKPPVFAQPETYRAKDGSAIYVEARMSEGQYEQYIQSIYNRVGRMMVSESTDTTEIKTRIGEIYLQELEPYLYFEDQQTVGAKMGEANANVEIQTTDKLYPNPTQETLYLEFDAGTWERGEIHIVIHDLLGKQIISNTINYQGQKAMLSTKELAEGTYIVTARQSQKIQHYKIVKKKQ